ncbi:hypothetical protein ACOZ38_08055 [Sphaerisporangium viridialbum]|uniref:hypothetical protein n=1 Tax=Sphaerisporangium viridialbum TaxID=46189 RepID=UPI003C71F99C
MRRAVGVVQALDSAGWYMRLAISRQSRSGRINSTSTPTRDPGGVTATPRHLVSSRARAR